MFYKQMHMRIIAAVFVISPGEITSETNTSSNTIWNSIDQNHRIDLKSYPNLVFFPKNPEGTSVISSLNDKINNFCPTF